MTDKPGRSRFRLSLRSLMVIVLVTGATIGWKANRVRNQRMAVEAIKAANGAVVYDFQFTNYVGPGVGLRPNKEPSAPRWLRKLLGDEYFQEVTMVNFPSAVSADILPALAKLDHLVALGLDASKLDDASYAQIGKLPRLQSLSLSRTTMTDVGIAHIAGANRLRRLAIFGADGLTDAGMAPLAALTDLKSLEIFSAPQLTAFGLKNLGPTLANLEILVLYRTALADEGMDCFDDCRKLQTLSLTSASIGDAGFARFRNMESLKTLIVHDNDMTDEGLNALRGLKNLRSLSIGKSRITDAGLVHLEGLHTLDGLGLIETRISDAGLESVRKLKGLKFLSIQGTQVSPEAIARLKADCPALKISSGPAPPMRVAPAPTGPPAKK